MILHKVVLHIENNVRSEARHVGTLGRLYSILLSGFDVRYDLVLESARGRARQWKQYLLDRWTWRGGLSHQKLRI